MQTVISRREMLTQSGIGLGTVALTWMLHQETASGAAAAGVNPLAPKASHFAARAKSVIFLMMEGGPSHIDTFDPKPELR